jgi:hypothetical protein
MTYRFFVTLVFSFFLSGCGQGRKEVFPKENFAVVEVHSGGANAVGSFNIAYKDFPYKSDYPWCLHLSIALDSSGLFSNGLPDPSESEVAHKLEDELLTEIKKKAVAHYVGDLFNDAFLDVYVYLDKPEEIHRYLQTQINKEGLVRGFGYTIDKDAPWTTVEHFLSAYKKEK